MDSVAVGDVGADSEEPPGGARGGALRRVGLSGHRGVDAFAHLYPHSRLAVALQIEDGDRRPRLNVHGGAFVVDGNENNWALGGLKGFGTHRIARIDSHEYVDTGAPRVDDAGVQVDEFAGADGPVEVEVGDVGGHTVSATPLRGDGAACFVYPFQKRRAVHDSDHADIGRPHTEALNQRVARSIWSAGLLCRVHFGGPPLSVGLIDHVRAARGEGMAAALIAAIPGTIHRFAAVAVTESMNRARKRPPEAAASSLTCGGFHMLGPTHRTRRPAMAMGLLIIVVAIAIAALLVWLGRARRARLTSPEERYRRDIQGLRPRGRALTANVSTEELWSAGATPKSKHSRAKKAGAMLSAGLISGCGGCGGCGCGG